MEISCLDPHFVVCKTSLLQNVHFVLYTIDVTCFAQDAGFLNFKIGRHYDIFHTSFHYYYFDAVKGGCLLFLSWQQLLVTNDLVSWGIVNKFLCRKSSTPVSLSLTCDGSVCSVFFMTNDATFFLIVLSSFVVSIFFPIFLSYQSFCIDLLSHS